MNLKMLMFLSVWIKGGIAVMIRKISVYIIFFIFISVFSSKTQAVDADVYAVITQVAIINAVLAGLPGKMGVGVAVSIARHDTQLN